MKTRHFFAFALALVATVFTACEKPGETTGGGDGAVVLTPAKTEYTVKVGETVQLEVTVTPAGTALTYTSLNPAYATVDAKGVVTGVAAGNTIVTVAAGEVKSNIIVKVTAGGSEDNPGEKPVVKGSRIWTIYMDAETSEPLGDKVIFSFMPNNDTRNLYFWEGTYGGNTASGSNYFQTNMNGGFLSAIVLDKGWSGMGFSIKTGDAVSLGALDALVDEIKADPAKYHCHMAIKSTQEGGSHYFTLFGLGAGNTTGLKWCVGPKYVAESNGSYEITYNGKWNVIDFTFDKYAAVLDTYVHLAGGDKGCNILTIGSSGVEGNILNLDAFYIYKE